MRAAEGGQRNEVRSRSNLDLAPSSELRYLGRSASRQSSLPINRDCQQTATNYLLYQSRTYTEGSPYLQHRVATLLVQHGRRHQNHPTINPFLKSCRFRLCLVQAAVVNLFVLNLVCFISVCPCIPETGRLENTYVLPLWYLALVLAGCCCQLVCFKFVVLRFRLPIPKTGRL